MTLIYHLSVLHNLSFLSVVLLSGDKNNESAVNCAEQCYVKCTDGVTPADNLTTLFESNVLKAQQTYVET